MISRSVSYIADIIEASRLQRQLVRIRDTSSADPDTNFNYNAEKSKQLSDGQGSPLL